MRIDEKNRPNYPDNGDVCFEVYAHGGELTLGNVKGTALKPIWKQVE